MTPRVTVLMAVHDGADYVAEAIESVLGQTYTDFEFLVVDDASRDETPEILTTFTDERLVVSHNELNIGLTASLARGLERARGEYVARQDADDRSRPERLARQVAFLDAHPEIALCGTWAQFVDQTGKTVEVFAPPLDSAELARELLSANQFVHGSFCFRRSEIAELGGYRIGFRYGQDYDLALRTSEWHDVANIDEVLYDFRLHPGAVGFAQGNRQRPYLALAQRLARERRESGTDALDLGADAEALLAVQPIVDDDPLSAGTRYLWRVGDMRGYRGALVRELLRHPARPHLYGRLAVALVPAAVRVRLIRAWHGQRRRRP